MNFEIERYSMGLRLGLLWVYLIVMSVCGSERTLMDSTKLIEFGTRYTAA